MLNLKLAVQQDHLAFPLSQQCAKSAKPVFLTNLAFQSAPEHKLPHALLHDPLTLRRNPRGQTQLNLMQSQRSSTRYDITLNLVTPGQQSGKWEMGRENLS
jgi:hypothetical protein